MKTCPKCGHNTIRANCPVCNIIHRKPRKSIKKYFLTNYWERGNYKKKKDEILLTCRMCKKVHLFSEHFVYDRLNWFQDIDPKKKTFTCSKCADTWLQVYNKGISLVDKLSYDKK